MQEGEGHGYGRLLHRSGLGTDSGYADNGFDLHGDLPWQRPDANCRPGMSTRIAENRHEQIRTAVDDRRMIAKIRGGIDHPQHLHDAAYPREVTERGMKHGDEVKPRQARMCISVFYAYARADFSAVEPATRMCRSLARQVDQRA